ncbi:MAG: GDSL-type esterase/lipase family protein [Bacteroidales bacterium]|nr:GDSL-type esterase/lipase family protein [Bacteroidales bacterium]
MNNRFLFILSTFILLQSYYGLSQELQLEEPIRFLSLGDSYTIGTSVPASNRWPQQLYDSLTNRGYQTESLSYIAQNGWRTDRLNEAIENANMTIDYNLVSLLIGVNNQYQGRSIDTYKSEKLLKKAITLAGGNKSSVFVLSTPDYAYTPYGVNNIMQISEEIKQFNNVNKYIAGDYNIKYYDITHISQRGLSSHDLVAVDGLHPSGKMYSEWVNLILKDIPIKSSDSVTDVSSLDMESEINIYPNPASDILFIDIDESDNIGFNIQLINLRGAVVLDQIHYNSKIRLNLVGTSPGLYLLKVGYKNNLLTKKILIQPHHRNY